MAFRHQRHGHRVADCDWSGGRLSWWCRFQGQEWMVQQYLPHAASATSLWTNPDAAGRKLPLPSMRWLQQELL